MSGPDPEVDPRSKWRRFSRSIMAVLCVSIVAVTALVSVVAVRRIVELSAAFQTRKAQNLARFAGRSAFVPLSLEDLRLLEETIKPYLDDPDLAYLIVSDSRGKVWFGQGHPPATPPAGLIEASHEIGSVASGQASLGMVRVGIGSGSARAAARRAILGIAAAGALTLLAAVGLGLALVAEMTRRFQELVGEARLAEELRRSNEELERFAYIASHDLQEPLRKISTFSELLAKRYKGKLDADADKLIHSVIDGAQRMSALISALLAFSRVGREALPVSPTDLNAVVAEVLRDLEMLVRDARAEVLCGPLPTLVVNPTHMARVFQNLIANALKFRGAEPPRVEISAKRNGPEWLFCVKDNGIGIPADQADRLFVLFRRLHSRAEYPGTGIGLALSKKMVTQYGGRIWVESDLGKGSRFFFTIPAAKER